MRQDLENLRIGLAKAYNRLPHDVQPIALNLMQIIKAWDDRSEKQFRLQYAELQRRLSAA